MQPFVSYATNTGQTTHLASGNDIAVYPFTVPFKMDVRALCAFIGVGDGSNNSDIGIYDVNGTLLGHIGAQKIGTAAAQSFGILDGPIILEPGTYLFAFTSEDVTLAWAVGSPAYPISLYSTNSVSSGGELPASIDVLSEIGEDITAAPHQGYPPVMILR